MEEAGLALSEGGSPDTWDCWGNSAALGGEFPACRRIQVDGILLGTEPSVVGRVLKAGVDVWGSSLRFVCINLGKSFSLVQPRPPRL